VWSTWRASYAGHRREERRPSTSLAVQSSNFANVKQRAGKGGAALRTAVSANADRFATDLAPVSADIRAQGATSLRAIAAELTARGMTTRRGGTWGVGNVKGVLGRVITTTSKIRSSRRVAWSCVCLIDMRIWSNGDWFASGRQQPAKRPTLAETKTRRAAPLRASQQARAHICRCRRKAGHAKDKPSLRTDCCHLRPRRWAIDWISEIRLVAQPAHEQRANGDAFRTRGDLDHGDTDWQRGRRHPD
jgi:hypothetical protein